MRNTFASTFYELGRTDKRLAVIVADISPAGSISKFREEFPDRFINTGVAEQVMIGLAAGMAQRGMRPFAYTIAPFALFRPFEMIRLDLAYQELPVTVVGMGCGVVYSTLGGTHQTMEDIAVAAAIPGMQVLSPCDPEEARLLTRYLATENQRPAYLRIGKSGEKDLTAKAVDPFVFGKLRYLKRGGDVCILGHGSILQLGLDLAARLEARGQSASVVSAHCIKPLDVEGLAQIFAAHKHVIVIEEHVPHGGLASRVKEAAWDNRAGCTVQAFTLKDKFVHLYGKHEDLLRAHGLDADAILPKIPAK